MRQGSASIETLCAILIGCVASAACGGAETQEPKTASDVTTAARAPDRPTMSASAEIGALDEGRVSSTFHGALGGLQRCLTEGARKNELLGGDIAFLVKIGSTGKVVHAHAERSTLGDRDTEKCMLHVLEKKQWPEPEGGDVGIARSSFSFDMPNDERPPTEWEPERVQGDIATVTDKIDKCKRGARGKLTATVYVDPDGAAVSAGIASSDDSGESAADCIVAVLKEAKYSSPGSWPAKVTFPL